MYTSEDVRGPAGASPGLRGPRSMLKLNLYIFRFIFSFEIEKY